MALAARIREQGAPPHIWKLDAKTASASRTVELYSNDAAVEEIGNQLEALYQLSGERMLAVMTADERAHTNIDLAVAYAEKGLVAEAMKSAAEGIEAVMDSRAREAALGVLLHPELLTDPSLAGVRRFVFPE